MLARRTSSRHHGVVRKCALPALILGLTACQPEPSPILGEKVYESENFEVYASEGLLACGGTFENVEDWLASFAGASASTRGEAASVLLVVRGRLRDEPLS